MIPQQLNLFEDEQPPLWIFFSDVIDVSYSPCNSSINKIPKQDLIVLINSLESVINRLKAISSLNT